MYSYNFVKISIPQIARGIQLRLKILWARCLRNKYGRVCWILLMVYNLIPVRIFWKRRKLNLMCELMKLGLKLIVEVLCNLTYKVVILVELHRNFNKRFFVSKDLIFLNTNS